MRTLTANGWALVAIGLIALLTLGYCQITKPGRDATHQAEASATVADGLAWPYARQPVRVFKDDRSDVKELRQFHFYH